MLESNSVNEQRTPEPLSTQIEDESICEKLLGWKPHPLGWVKQDGFMYAGCGTPTFRFWAEAGLILDALKARGMDRLELSVDDEGDWKCVMEWDRHQMHRSRYSSESAALAVRGAALSYIEAARL